MLKKIELSPYEQSLKQNLLGKSKYFDFKMGMLGALFMGTVIYHINSRYGVDQAYIAAIKEGSKSLMIGGITMKLCENISTAYENKKISKFVAVAIPTVISVGTTYLIHSLDGTPKPVESTLPSVMSAGTFVWWANRKRNQLENLLDFDN